MSSDRPFITCHVLDTTSGRPAEGIEVELRLVEELHQPWHGTTDADGRVLQWHPVGNQTLGMNEVAKSVKERLTDGPAERAIWSLIFKTEDYFGRGKTFWPEVELRFATKKQEEHYHVPLLLTPYSYTTYRGS